MTTTYGIGQSMGIFGTRVAWAAMLVLTSGTALAVGASVLARRTGRSHLAQPSFVSSRISPLDQSTSAVVGGQTPQSSQSGSSE